MSNETRWRDDVYAEIDYNDIDADGLTMAGDEDISGGRLFVGETCWAGCTEDGTRTTARAVGYFVTPDLRGFWKLRVDWQALTATA
jgi:hypothetical protein